MFEQERDPVGPARQDSASGGFGRALWWQVFLADRVVECNCLGRFALSEPSFGAEDAAFGDSRAEVGRAFGQGGFECSGCRVAADMSQRDRGGRGDFGAGVFQLGHERVDRLLVAADADGVDDSDQGAALDCCQGGAQGLVWGGTGDDFEGDASPGGELFTAQEAGQGRDGIGGAADGQLF